LDLGIIFSDHVGVANIPGDLVDGNRPRVATLYQGSTYDKKCVHGIKLTV
jgi:hypothetical protein